MYEKNDRRSRRIVEQRDRKEARDRVISCLRDNGWAVEGTESMECLMGVVEEMWKDHVRQLFSERVVQA